MKRGSALLLSLFLLCLSACAPSAVAPPGDLSCTVSICCTALLRNTDLSPEKARFVPSDGYVLHETTVSFSDGESVFDVLRRACTENVCTDNCAYCKAGGIPFESVYTPGYGTYYVQGIHQLYEKDAGSASGWFFSVNGESATKGCSETPVHAGDTIEWVYTCDGFPSQ